MIRIRRTAYERLLNRDETSERIRARIPGDCCGGTVFPGSSFCSGAGTSVRDFRSRPVSQGIGTSVPAPFFEDIPAVSGARSRLAGITFLSVRTGRSCGEGTGPGAGMTGIASCSCSVPRSASLPAGPSAGTGDPESLLSYPRGPSGTEVSGPGIPPGTAGTVPDSGAAASS